MLKGQSLYPFWGATSNYITGLDPLGLQFHAESIYASILPGITNLTNRIRYYGFYCWLLQQYENESGEAGTRHQQKFIRRAEYLLALMMKKVRPDVQQIAGSDFASKELAKASEGIIDLGEGADFGPGKSTLYFKFPSGAFGQYYYGAMRALGLVYPAQDANGKHLIYRISMEENNSWICGEILARGFSEALKPGLGEIFLEFIKTSRFDTAFAYDLYDGFFINKLPEISAENQLYRKILLQQDFPAEKENSSSLRRDTILALIRHAEQTNGKFMPHEYFRSCYHKGFSGGEETIANIHYEWFAYQLTEYHQYACGAIFWAALRHLKSFENEQYLPAFLEDFCSKLLEMLISELPGFDADSPLNSVAGYIGSAFEEEQLFGSVNARNNQNYMEMAASGLLLLLKVYAANCEAIPRMGSGKNFLEVRARLNRVGNRKGQSLKDFIRVFVWQDILKRHLDVANRKMGNGSLSTHKFLVEDQFIRYIDNAAPRTTSPRMGAMANFLSDLGLLDNEKNIIPEEAARLKELLQST